MVHFDRGLMIALDRRGAELAVGSATTLAGLVGVAVTAQFGGLFAISGVILLRAAISWPLRLRFTTRVLGMPAWSFAFTLLRILLVAGVATAPAWILVSHWPLRGQLGTDLHGRDSPVRIVVPLAAADGMPRAGEGAHRPRQHTREKATEDCRVTARRQSASVSTSTADGSLLARWYLQERARTAPMMRPCSTHEGLDADVARRRRHVDASGLRPRAISHSDR